MNKQKKIIEDHTLQAVDALDATDRENFKKLGKELYGHLNFKGVSLINDDVIEDDLVAFVTRQLDDGMHPSCLEEGEHKVMNDKYGDKWYERWNYVHGDLTEIVTLDRK